MSIRVQYAVSPEDLAAVSRSASAGAVKRENIMDSLRRLQQAQQFAAEQQLRREQMAQAGQENQADRQFRYGLAQLQTGADASQATQEFQNRQALAKASDEAAMERLKASAGLDASNAEHRANLDQRNWGLQHGPKFSPEMGQPQDPNAAVAAGRPPGPGAPPPTPDQSQRARLIEAIRNNEPWAIEQGQRVGILQFQKGDKERAAQLQQQISQIGHDTRMTPQERSALQAELGTELASIRPVMVPPADQPQTPIEIANSMAMRLNPVTGKFHPINDTTAPENAPIFAPNPKTGKLEKIYDPSEAKGTTKDTTPDPIKQRESFQRRYDEAVKALRKTKTVNGEDETVFPTPDEIEAHLKAQDDLFQRLHPQQESNAKTVDPFGGLPRFNQGKIDAGLMDQWTARPGFAPPPKVTGVNPFGQKAPATSPHGSIVSEDGTSKPLEPVPGLPGQLGTKEKDGSYSIYQTGDDGKTVRVWSILPKASETDSTTNTGGKKPFQDPIAAGGVTPLPNHRPGKDDGPVPIPNHNPNDKADVLPLKYKFDGHELPVEKHVPLQDGTKMPIVTAKINGHSVMTTPQGNALTIISKTPEGAYRTLAKMMSPTAGTFDDPIYAPDAATHDELSKVLPKGVWITDGKRRLKNE